MSTPESRKKHSLLTRPSVFLRTLLMTPKEPCPIENHVRPCICLSCIMSGNIPILHTTSYRSESAIVQTWNPQRVVVCRFEDSRNFKSDAAHVVQDWNPKLIWILIQRWSRRWNLRVNDGCSNRWMFTKPGFDGCHGAGITALSVDTDESG
jgi:hypothetical protein